VELTKIDDIDTNTNLANAVFNLLDENGQVVEEGLKTNAEGKIVVENLRPGTYQFVETIAPEHYVLRAEPIEFTIDRSQKETLLVKAENALKPGDVELTKVDDIDGTALEGAVFKIVDANDEKKVIRENVKTGADGKVTVKDLEPGTYRFIETEAPKDYVLNTNPIEFTIDKSQQSFATV
ncbi:SpaA isopeptide-forming pilin-related protein, partial [Bacillus cereus group sp. BY112LC]|uniref:MSCRAMM family protein n=1 Tax=Bacillus cereus group sp. BY112LC TaxID=3018086 RepID=UPI0022DF1545